MRLFGFARHRGRAVAAFLLAGLVTLLWIAPAPADVIINPGSSVSSSSFASSPGGGFSNSFSFPFSGGTTSAFSASSSSGTSFGGGSGSASNFGGATASLSGPANGVQTISGSLVNTGSASSSGFNTSGANSNGFQTVSGSATLTPANSLNTEYAFKTTATATGISTAAASAFNSATGESFATVSLPGVSTSSDSFSTSFTSSPNVNGFTASGSGILLPGNFSFFAQLFGQSNASSGFFGGSASASNFGSLGFSIVLTPIPEPGTMTLLGLSTLGLAGYGWMRRRKQVATA